MIKKIIFCWLISSAALAQKITVSGQVTDTVQNALPSATVMLLSAQDSSLVAFASTDVQGNFEIKNSAGEYIFKVTFVGYKTYTTRISALAGQVLSLGKIQLEVARTKLDEVVIEAERTPVVVKKDTIEFNATAFKTAPNSNVENLLKKLPGVEVDNDGNITAQGERVRRVTVDGKDFFGGRDPKMATRNLPADAVDKVQIHDRKSDQSQFTGIDDGQREKAINLELKEEKRNAAFGNITGGLGTDDRFSVKANFNKFSKGKQLSFLGMGNNVNEQGFSIEDYLSFTGGATGLGGGGGRISITFDSDNASGVPLNFGNQYNGLMTSYAGGANFSQDFSKNTEGNGSYFFNQLNHDVSTELNRDYFFPQSNLNYSFNQKSRQNNVNNNHKANVMIDHKIDSMNSVKITANASYNDTNAETRSFSTNTRNDGTLINENDRQTLSDGISSSVTANALWRHKFNKKGRTFSANLGIVLTDSDRESEQKSTITTYNNGVGEDSVIHQRSNQISGNQSYSAALSYTEPLGGRKYLEANYSYRQNDNQVDRDVFNVVNEELFADPILSNEYNSSFQYHRAGLNFRVNRKNYNITVGTSLQQTNLSGDLITQGVTIDRTFENILPVARFNYDFSNNTHLRLDYETSVREPGITQLSPAIDNTDPLNIYLGNPDLQPAYQQNLRLHFNTFNPSTFIGLFGFVDATYTTDAIVNAQWADPQTLIRTTTPVNVDRSTRVSANVNFTFSLRKINSRVSIGTDGSEQQSINLLNDVESTINQSAVGGNIRYEYNYKEFFNLTLRADIDRQATNYEFNANQNQLFFNKTYTAETTWSLLKNYQLTSGFDYLVYDSKTTDFSQTIPLWNVSVSRFFLKNKSGELKISANNLLDRNIGASQTASGNYVERQTTNSLGRFFMISFTYALNKYLNPMNMRRGGMIRITR